MTLKKRGDSRNIRDTSHWEYLLVWPCKFPPLSENWLNTKRCVKEWMAKVFPDKQITRAVELFKWRCLRRWENISYHRRNHGYERTSWYIRDKKKRILHPGPPIAVSKSFASLSNANKRQFCAVSVCTETPSQLFVSSKKRAAPLCRMQQWQRKGWWESWELNQTFDTNSDRKTLTASIAQFLRWESTKWKDMRLFRLCWCVHYKRSS